MKLFHRRGAEDAEVWFFLLSGEGPESKKMHQYYNKFQ